MPSAARSSTPGRATSATTTDPPSCITDEARALLGAVAADQGWDLASLPLAELAAAVDRCRLLADEQARRSDPLAPLVDAYEQRLLQHGAIDFVAMLAPVAVADLLDSVGGPA